MAETHGATVTGFGFIFKDTQLFAFIVFYDLVFDDGVFYQGLADFCFVVIDQQENLISGGGFFVFEPMIINGDSLTFLYLILTARNGNNRIFHTCGLYHKEGEIGYLYRVDNSQRKEQ